MVFCLMLIIDKKQKHGFKLDASFQMGFAQWYTTDTIKNDVRHPIRKIAY